MVSIILRLQEFQHLLRITSLSNLAILIKLKQQISSQLCYKKQNDYINK
jgi:hypothetical protein